MTTRRHKPDTKHNLNTATAEELEQTGRIDGVRARNLIEHRARRGPFSAWREVMEVQKFEQSTVERLQDAGFQLDHEKPSTETEPSGGRNVNDASAADLDESSTFGIQRAERSIGYRSRKSRV